ncbi:glycoside hydrolase family 3 C-terminal domain-containing protein [Lachnospiraceae bacterium 48-21]
MDTKKIARQIAAESIVLLKNDQSILPFSSERKVAFLGRAQIDTYFSGNGSGASRSSQNLNILEECEKRNLHVEHGLKEFYQEALKRDEGKRTPEFDFSKVTESVNSGIMYEIFGKYHAPEEEYEIPVTILENASAFTDTAVLVLGRNSGGEECDRHLKGDYYLTVSEQRLVEQVCRSFDNIVLILNINGLIDLSWTREYPSLKGILFLGICGEQGAAAVADILVGNVNPSGKLPVTIAQCYEDYPSAGHFSWDKENPDEILTYESYGLNAKENGSTGYEKSPVTVYQEGIYMGYRYFDTFGKAPLFPFGFGMSYTEFDIRITEIKRKKGGLEIFADVTNTGGRAGREVIQMYIAAVKTRYESPAQELKGFVKTGALKPGESETVSLFLPWREMSVYDEEEAAYVIGQGAYLLRCGNSSRNTTAVAKILVEKDILIEKCQNRLGLKACDQNKIKFLSHEKDTKKYSGSEEYSEIPTFIFREEDIAKDQDWEIAHEKKLRQTGKEEMNLKEFTIEELAALCVGYGPGTPFSAFGDGSDPETIFDEDGNPLTTNSHAVGFNGYVSPAMEKRGICSVFYKDGPSGIGETAWPSEMLLACAFDRTIWRKFGEAVGYECEKQQVDIWLAPAVNLHRNPLCGRNFEYISEDPYLTGICACEVTKGVQENHSVLVCPKHYAVNEQETYRRGSSKKNYDAVDSIIQERVVRELYLKPFEMLVKDAEIHCLMTSFNKINGTFAGGSDELCTHILREEWEYDGVVVTDWGDMDVVVDGSDAVAAGNDVVMPGGPPVIKQIIEGHRQGRVTRGELETAVRHLLRMVEYCKKDTK